MLTYKYWEFAGKQSVVVLYVWPSQGDRYLKPRLTSQGWQGLAVARALPDFILKP